MIRIDNPSTSAKRLYVDLRSGSGFVKANINLHRSLDHVIVRKSPTLFGESGCLEDDLKSLECVAQMENLTRLDLVDFEGDNLSARGLAIVMIHARKLQALRLDKVRIVGSDKDFAESVNELRRHSALTELCLVGCLPSKETTMIQAWAEALSSLKTLQVVEIVETRFSPYESWTGTALATLCQSASLTTLHIRGLRFLRDDHIVLMARTLQKQQGVLKELSLLSDIGEDAVRAICNMLRVNQSLQILSLNRIMDGEQASEIAEALAENSTLREIRLYFLYCVVHKLRVSFLELVKQNCTLEKVDGGWACSNIEFFLKLNRAGRKRLMHGSSSPWDWVEVLASQHDDLDALYYLLSQNPTLCCVTRKAPHAIKEKEVRLHPPCIWHV
jgi:hypothetical protein